METGVDSFAQVDRMAGMSPNELGIVLGLAMAVAVVAVTLLATPKPPSRRRR
jgi:hypothetical protein